MSKKKYIHNIKKANMENCIILSAGAGMRRKYAFPEPLYPVGDSVLIDYQIKNIRKYNNKCNIILVVGFKSKKVIDYIHNKYSDVKIIENNDYYHTTPVESLRLALNIINEEDTYFMYGNNLFNSYCLRINEKNDPCLLKKPYKVKSSYNLGILEQNGVLKNLSYGANYEWAELMFLPMSILKDFKKVIKTIKPHEDMLHLINKFNKLHEIKVVSNKKSESINIFNIE